MFKPVVYFAGLLALATFSAQGSELAPEVPAVAPSEFTLPAPADLDRHTIKVAEFRLKEFDETLSEEQSEANDRRIQANLDNHLARR